MKPGIKIEKGYLIQILLEKHWGCFKKRFVTSLLDKYQIGMFSTISIHVNK